MEKEKLLSDLSKKYERICHTIAKNILHNDEDAEECFNDALLSLWNSVSDFSGNPGAYLCKTVRNLALNRLEYLSAEKRGSGNAEIAISELDECIPAEDILERRMDETALRNIVEGFLKAQPMEKRNIFIRRYWYMFSVSEIAITYGMSESKVKSVLFRMRKELRKTLEKEKFL